MTSPISVKTDITIHPSGPKSETFKAHEIVVDGKRYIVEVAHEGAYQTFTEEEWAKIGSSAHKVIQGLGGSQVKMADFTVEASTCNYLDTQKKQIDDAQSASESYQKGAEEFTEFFKKLWNHGTSSSTSSSQQSPALKQEESAKASKEEIKVMELPPSKIEEVKDENPEIALERKKNPKEQSSSVSESEALKVVKDMETIIQKINHEEKLLNQFDPEAKQSVVNGKNSSPVLVKKEPVSATQHSVPVLPPVKPAEKKKQAERRIKKPLAETKKPVIQKFTTGYRPPKSLLERIKFFFRTFFLLS